MIKKIIKEKTPYEMYFMTEAPVRKPWKKTVIAKTDKRLAKFDKNIHDSIDDFGLDDPESNPENEMELVDDADFDQNISDEDLEGLEDEVMDDSDSSENPEETDQNTETDDQTEDNQESDTNDVSTDGDSNNEENFEQNIDAGSGEDQQADQSTEQDQSTDQPEADTGNGETDTGDGDDSSGSDSGEVTVTPDGADQEEDFDQNTSDDSTQPETATATDAATSTTGQQVTDESILKYSLYRNLKNLYVAVQNYQTKFDEYTTTSYNFNMVIKVAKNKLAELELMMYEYMTVKFKEETYIGSMHFYHKCIAAIKMIFNLVKANKVQDDGSEMIQD